MGKTQRTTLFFAVTLLFFILAGSSVLYAQGYRIDLAAQRITQTGAFYFKAAPQSASIYIDGELTKRTDFLFGSALTRNFLPGEYHVRIEREGYHPWEKTLEIRPKEVTEAKRILLFPRDISFGTITAEIERLWPHPEGNRVFVQRTTEEGALIISELSLSDASETVLWQLPEGQSVTIHDLHWRSNPNRLLVQFSRPDHPRRAYLVFEEPQGYCPAGICRFLELEGEILQAAFSPRTSQEVILIHQEDSRNTLVVADVRAPESSLTFSDNAISFASSGNTLYWIDQSNTIWRQELSDAQSPEFLIRADQLDVSANERLEVTLLRNDIFVRSGSEFYRINPGQDRIELLFENLRTTVLDPRAEKFLIGDGTELWLYTLQPQYEQPQYQAHEKIFLTRFGAPMENPAWLTASYIAAFIDGQLRIIETDNRDGINIVTVGQFDNPQNLIWNTQQRIFLFHDNGALRVSDRMF